MGLIPNDEPSEVQILREEGQRLAMAMKERRMKFRIREGFEDGFTSGDLRGRSGDIVETSPERGAQLAHWLEPVDATPQAKAKAQESKPVAETGEIPGAPPVLNNMVGGSPAAGGPGRKGKS